MSDIPKTYYDSSPQRSRQRSCWWLEKGEKHRDIFSIVRNLHHNSRNRLERNLRCLRLYGSIDGFNLSGPSYLNYARPNALPDDRLRYNICASMVDTVHSKIGKMKPRVSFLTSGGTPKAQRQAKDLSKFILGSFYTSKIHELHAAAFRDAAIMDVGAIRHRICDDRIVSERVLPFQLYVDSADALYGGPKTLFFVNYLTRSQAMALYPDKADAIKSATQMIDDSATTEYLEEFVCVIEAWRLPSHKGAGDGRHCIVVGNCDILDEPYEYLYFPFTFLRWTKPVVGYWGQSLVDRLTPIQAEINKMLRVIQRSFHLGSTFKVFLERGSQILRSHLNNDIGSLVEYTGTPPTYYAPKVVHEEYFNHLRFLIQSAYEEAGISQLSASARKPAGLESGKALREYNNIESERFAIVSQEYEQSFLQSARIHMDLAREIGDDYAVVAQSKNFVESIKWGDVAPADENAFIMQMFPVSMLPHEPAGRLAFIQELISSGIVPPDYAASLLDFPDLESYLNIKNAALEDLLKTLESIVEGNYQPPEPFQDLQNGIPLMNSAYLRYRHEDVDPSVLDDLQRWIASADSLLKKAAAAQQGGPQPSLPINPQEADGGQAAPQTSAPMQAGDMPVASMPA